MICDAHVHVGYWRANGVLKYFSPRRVVGVLDRCGVDAFVVSSTSPQAGAVNVSDLVREAKEVVRLAKGRAHVYCWLTGPLFDADPNLEILDCGVYEGVKLHECETPWNTQRKNVLMEILDHASRNGMNMMFHCGHSEGCRPGDLRWMPEKYPGIKFNFAHCRPTVEILDVMRTHRNVYTDVACLSDDGMAEVGSSDVADRIMYGSDFPVVEEGSGLTAAYRKRMLTLERQGLCAPFNAAFRKYCG